MPSERRLLVVIESLGVGGTESHLLRTLPGLVNRGWNVAVFCFSERGEGAARMEAAGVKVVGPKSTQANRDSPLRYSVTLLLEARALYAFLRRWRPDVAHFYLPRPYLLGAPMALAAGTPIKVMSRRSLSHYQRNWPMVADIERQLHKRMDVLIGNSAAVVADLLTEGVPEEKIELIYNGVEVYESLPSIETRRALGINEEALVGIIVANLIPYKGHRELVEGLAGIASQMPAPWRILLAGRDHNLWQELQLVIQKSGLAENIQFLGQRSDVPRLLAAADFALLTSREEGFSNVILEGMAAGLPMIVTAVGGNPEAVVDDVTGLVVPPNDPNAIGEAVLRLACDPDLRRRLGAAGRRRVQNEFSLDRCITLHSNLYDELLAKARDRDLPAGESTGSAAPANIRRKKRPLMFAYWGRYGGLPQFSLDLADACHRLGRMECTTISVSSTNELFDRYRRYGESIFPVGTYQSAAGALDILELMKMRRALAERAMLDGTRAFVTLMSHVWSPLMAPVLSKESIRHTVIVHDADPHPGDPTAWVNRWLLREAKAADQVVTLTRAVADQLIRSKVIPEEKISVLFHPDLKYQPEFFAGPSSGRSLRVLFFGRILPYKGLSIFVDAIEALRGAGVAVDVGVYGEGELGSERKRLEALGAEIRNGWIDAEDISRIFDRHDVLVVSHTKASQSGVIAAAHGAGLPVIATPVGGLIEQVVPDVTGLIAEDATGAALAAVIKRVAEDRFILQRMRRNIIASRGDRSMDRFLSELSDIAFGGDRRG